MTAAREFLYSKYDGNLTENSTVEGWSHGFDWELFTDRTSAGQFFGSFRLNSATVADGVVTYEFYNETGTESFFYGSVTKRVNEKFVCSQHTSV